MNENEEKNVELTEEEIEQLDGNFSIDEEEIEVL